MLENKRDDDSSITIKEFMERRISDFRKEGRNSYADMNTTQGTRSISFTMPEEAKEIAARCIRNI